MHSCMYIYIYVQFVFDVFIICYTSLSYEVPYDYCILWVHLWSFWHGPINTKRRNFFGLRIILHVALEELNNDDDMRLLVFAVNVLNFPCCSRMMVTSLWGNGRWELETQGRGPGWIVEHLRLTCDEFGEILEALDFSRRVSNGQIWKKLAQGEESSIGLYRVCIYKRRDGFRVACVSTFVRWSTHLWIVS